MTLKRVPSANLEEAVCDHQYLRHYDMVLSKFRKEMRKDIS